MLVTRRSPAESQRRQVSFLSSAAACRRAARVGAVIHMTDDDLGSTLLGAEIASPRLILKMGGKTAQSFPSELGGSLVSYILLEKLRRTHKGIKTL